MQPTRTAVLNPEVYQKNLIEGLDPQNLNFTKLLAVYADSWFGGSYETYFSSFNDETSIEYVEYNDNFGRRSFVTDYNLDLNQGGSSRRELTGGNCLECEDVLENDDLDKILGTS